MTDREKVIKGLECCLGKGQKRGMCEDCPYDTNAGRMKCNLGDMHVDALALLKAQEPMVATWQDVIGAAIECKPLYIEVKDSEDKEPGDDRWAMVTQYKDSITNGMIRAMSSYVTSEVLFAEDYGKRWRCWTSRPTDEQREATPW